MKALIVDRDEAIKKIKNRHSNEDGIWCKEDQPAEKRAVNGFLLGLKYLLTTEEWGYQKAEVKVDLDKGVLTIAGEFVVSAVLKGRVKATPPDSRSPSGSSSSGSARTASIRSSRVGGAVRE